MTRRKVVESRAAIGAVALLILLAASCAKPIQMPKPVSGESGALGVSIRLCPIWSMFPCRDPQFVVFIRLGESDDPRSPDRIYLSKAVVDERAYLLNAEPGRYAVAAAFFIQQQAGTGRKLKSTVYLPKEMVEKSIAELVPGSVHYLGTYEVKMGILEDPDDVQASYYAFMERSGAISLSDFDFISGQVTRIIRGKPTFVVKSSLGLTKGVIRAMLTNKYSFQGALMQVERNPASERAFWKEALGDMKKSGWEARVRRRMAELKR